MGQSVVRLSEDRWAIVRDQSYYELEQRYQSHREVMDAYFADTDAFLADHSQALDPASNRVLPPVTQDVQIFCQGLNYASHREEGGASASASQIKGQNLIFSKPPSSISGPQDDIVRPKGCALLDYEIELALVMKRDVPANTQITPDTLLNYVGGFTLANDVSARDFMFGAPMMQWFKGKGQRTFCPTGPILYLLDLDELDLLSNLALTLSLNGEVRQQATTDQLIHKPHETLTELAGFADINRGDLLLTGTPGGVILNANLKVGLAILLNFTNDSKRRDKLLKSQEKIRYLQPGDQLTLKLQSKDGTHSFGTQTTGVRDAIA